RHGLRPDRDAHRHGGLLPQQRGLPAALLVLGARLARGVGRHARPAHRGGPPARRAPRRARRGRGGRGGRRRRRSRLHEGGDRAHLAHLRAAGLRRGGRGAAARPDPGPRRRARRAGARHGGAVLDDLV
ncbi:MAG: hypothetical protein AVDCRST_MAG13-1131, partial [uncultured Solirubrobacteraceae bacterium]